MVTLPFTDVSGNIFFCQIAEAYFSGLTLGTTPTTYGPDDSVRRDQMAAFVTRTQDSALRRGNRRAALGQWATPTSLPITGRTTVGSGPVRVKSDGTDLWVADNGSSDVKRVRASDGVVLGTWTTGAFANGVLVARGRIYVTGATNLYLIDPSQPPGVVQTLSSTLGANSLDITTDGQFIWTANFSGSISRVDPDTGATTTLTTGFNQPFGILFDGVNLWVTDRGAGMLYKVNSSGAVIQNVAVGAHPLFPVFDGSNIWVPNFNSSSLTVVRVRDGMVLATLTGNGLNFPMLAAFDGQRILVTNGGGNSLSMWNATDLTPIGTFSAGPFNNGPYGVCSDGI
jgi:hypothetical protein